MRKAEAWFPWQIHGIRGSWAERRVEMRERRRKEGGEVRCARQELARAERRRTCAADGGIQSRPVGRQYTNQARGGVRMRTSSPSGPSTYTSLLAVGVAALVVVGVYHHAHAPHACGLQVSATPMWLSCSTAKLTDRGSQNLGVGLTAIPPVVILVSLTVRTPISASFWMNKGDGRVSRI
ncbi:uncharacterized protein LOC119277185 [Triticum dicoccoides]|uniref:uncharacterized protein LOC119277185 n=1 Tax=Triticum dicoccoides TaxID=85692 RepID=UPI00188F9AEC|nr:uncharacterized protein LOC119277185 [Triticum dicoccoides]